MIKERTSFVQILRSEIVPDLSAHTVVLAENPRSDQDRIFDALSLKGSGTLIKFESLAAYGIVTAGHVIRAIHNNKSSDPTSFLLFSMPSGSRYRKGIIEPFLVQIPESTITAYGKENELIEGPDIAWIPLNPDMARKIEEHKTSGAAFYNFEKRFAEFFEVIDQIRSRGGVDESDFGTSFSCYAIGWNAEKQIASGGNEFIIWCCEVIPKDLISINGWQFMDYRVASSKWNHTIEEHDDISTSTIFSQPSSWGGMSGGGIWQIYQDPSDPKRLIRQYGGTIFYEEKNDNGRFFRSHVFTDLLRVLKESRN